MKHHESPEERLRQYVQLVRKYHATLDLVSDRALARLPELVREAEEYVGPIASFQPGRPILDVGSGVGLPGLVIALGLPRRPVVLVERRRRRATFLKICVAQLGLSNAFVLEEDVRDVAPEDVGSLVGAPGRLDIGGAEGPVAVVTAQAVASFGDVYCLTRDLHAAEVLLVSRKGPDWREEVAGIPAVGDRAPAVRAESPLAGGGTLVAIEVPGGLPCPPSA